MSVVIPSFGHRGHLYDVVFALCHQRPRVREIIISHSGPGSPNLGILFENPLVSLEKSEEPLLSGAARNIGASKALGRWIAFIDDDVVVAQDWSANLQAALTNIPPLACMVGSIGYDRSGGYWGMSLWFNEFGSMHPYMPTRTVFGGASANMIVERSVFETAGGFPSNVARCVDVEFLDRCRRIGVQTQFRPEIRVGHRNVAGFRHCMKHSFTIGSGSARVRTIADLPGGFAVRYKALVPVLWPARMAQTTWRVLRYGRGHWGQFVVHSPGVILSLAAWTVGFFWTAVSHNSQAQP